jgi:hypothetical protein
MGVERDEALNITRAECESRGWGWRLPIQISRGWFNWTIKTNAGARSDNAYVRIRRRDGAIVLSGFSGEGL